MLIEEELEKELYRLENQIKEYIEIINETIFDFKKKEKEDYIIFKTDDPNEKIRHIFENLISLIYLQKINLDLNEEDNKGKNHGKRINEILNLYNKKCLKDSKNSILVRNSILLIMKLNINKIAHKKVDDQISKNSFKLILCCLNNLIILFELNLDELDPQIIQNNNNQDIFKFYPREKNYSYELIKKYIFNELMDNYFGSNSININNIIFVHLWKFDEFKINRLLEFTELLTGIWQNNKLVHGIKKLIDKKQQKNILETLYIINNSGFNWFNEIDKREKKNFDEYNFNFSNELFPIIEIFNNLKKIKLKLDNYIEEKWFSIYEEKNINLVEKNLKSYFENIIKNIKKRFFLIFFEDISFNEVRLFYNWIEFIFLILVFNKINSLTSISIKDFIENQKIYSWKDNNFFSKNNIDFLKKYIHFKSQLNLWEIQDSIISKKIDYLYESYVSKINYIESIIKIKKIKEKIFEKIILYFKDEIKNINDNFLKKELMDDLRFVELELNNRYFLFPPSWMYKKELINNEFNGIKCNFIHIFKNIIKWDVYKKEGNSRNRSGNSEILENIKIEILNFELSIDNYNKFFMFFEEKLKLYKSDLWKEEEIKYNLEITTFDNEDKYISKYNRSEWKYISKKDFEDDYEEIIIKKYIKLKQETINLLKSKIFRSFYYSLPQDRNEEKTLKWKRKVKNKSLTSLINFDIKYFKKNNIKLK